MDVADFEDFFTAMRPRLLRYASRWTDVDSANELAIQALATIWDKDLPAPSDASSQAQLEGLAFRVCAGLVNNHLRARARQERLLVAVQLDHLTRPTAAAAPDDVVLRHEGLTALLATLSVLERDAVALALYGYKVAEIAALRQTRPGTISMRLKRARKALRARLEGADDE